MSASDKVKEAAKMTEQILTEFAQWYAGKRVKGSRTRRTGGIVERNFSKGNKGRYVPLSQQYAKRKQQKYGNKPILVRTGTLKSLMVGGGVITVSGKRVRIKWTGLPAYAEYHDKGQGVPRRRPAHPQASDRDDMQKQLKAIKDRLVNEARRGRTGTRSGKPSKR